MTIIPLAKTLSRNFRYYFAMERFGTAGGCGVGANYGLTRFSIPTFRVSCWEEKQQI
jgi:hypothetical protein